MFVNYLVLVVSYLKKNVHFSYIIQSLYRPLKRSVACESSSDSKCLLPFQLSHFVWLDINILHVGSSTWIPNTHARIEGDFFRTTCGVAPLKWQYIYAWYHIRVLPILRNSHCGWFFQPFQSLKFESSDVMFPHQIICNPKTYYLAWSLLAEWDLKETTIQMVTKIQSKKMKFKLGRLFKRVKKDEFPTINQN